MKAMNLIIFDIDGTLCDTVDIDDRCFGEALKAQFQIDPAQIDWTQFKNITTGSDSGMAVEIVRELTGNVLKPEQMKKLQDYFHNILENEIKKLATSTEIPGASGFIASLIKSEEWGTGFATGSWEKSGRIKLFSAGIGIGSLPYSHSDYHDRRENIVAETIRRAKEYYQTENFEKIIYTGDGEWDFKTSKTLGIEFIGIDIENTGKLKKLGAEYIFKDYTEPEKILKTINLI